MALLKALFLACCFVALPVRGQPPACTSTSSSGSGTSVAVFDLTLAPFTSTAVLSISGTSFTLVFPGEVPVTWTIFAGAGLLLGLRWCGPACPTPPRLAPGVTFSLADLGLAPQQCGLALPRRIGVIIFVQYAVSVAADVGTGLGYAPRKLDQPWHVLPCHTRSLLCALSAPEHRVVYKEAHFGCVCAVHVTDARLVWSTGQSLLGTIVSYLQAASYTVGDRLSTSTCGTLAPKFAYQVFSVNCACPSSPPPPLLLPPSPPPPSPQPPSPPSVPCKASSGSGKGASLYLFDGFGTPISNTILRIRGTTFTMILPSEAPVSWRIHATDTTLPDGTSGVNTWVNGVCTSRTLPAPTLFLPNVPNSALDDIGVSFSLADLGIYPQCGSPLPRYIVLLLAAATAVSAVVHR